MSAPSVWCSPAAAIAEGASTLGPRRQIGGVSAAAGAHQLRKEIGAALLRRLDDGLPALDLGVGE